MKEVQAELNERMDKLETELLNFKAKNVRDATEQMQAILSMRDASDEYYDNLIKSTKVTVFLAVGAIVISFMVLCFFAGGWWF